MTGHDAAGWVGGDAVRAGGMMMAKKGKARHPRRAYTFTVLDGPTYGKKERPPFWANARPLLPRGYSPASPPDMARLPLDAFPLIEDIEVRLEAMRDSGGGRATATPYASSGRPWGTSPASPGGTTLSVIWRAPILPSRSARSLTRSRTSSRAGRS